MTTMEDLTERIVDRESYNFSFGGFGQVYRATLLASSEGSDYQKKVAIKLPDKRNIGNGGNSTSRDKAYERWQREIKAGQSVVHPNILPILGFCENPDVEYKEFKGIVFPYCANRDARVYVNAHRGVDCMSILCGVATALYTLHSSLPPVVHGDVKASNILIDDDGHPCLADFGLSHIDGIKGFTTQSVMGTCRWMASELLQATAENRSIRTTPASDIWAFAMTILEILTKNQPFAELKFSGAVFAGVVYRSDRPERPANPVITDAIWTLLQQCWQEDASARPDARRVGLVLDIIHGKNGHVGPSIVMAILNGVLDSARPDQNMANVDKCMPYICKWLNCPRGFKTLDSCIGHECAEFERRSSEYSFS